MDSFQLEQSLLSQGYQLVIGVDEAGRGPLAGPVVAAAVLCRVSNFQFPISKQKELDLIRDSKKLSEKQRGKAFAFIQENFFIGVGLCNHETIDRINILEASFLAMKKAVADLVRNKSKGTSQKLQENLKTIILVDGNKVIPNFSHEQKAIVGGDALVKSIAAASIVAKVTRDHLMLEADQKYPIYGFAKHKGYGTKMHLDALKMCGPCEIHRQSFAPVAKFAKINNS